MTLPLAEAARRAAGDVVAGGLPYRAGGSIPSLQASIRANWWPSIRNRKRPPSPTRSVEFA
jgi:hypothetical protein